MRKPIITSNDGTEVTHVQDLSTGQIWRADNRTRRGKGPFVPGSLPHINNVRGNRYNFRPPGKR